MTGGGKYDKIVERLREELQSTGIILIVVNGKLGEGFEVQVAPEIIPKIPPILRTVADLMDADIKALVEKHQPPKEQKPL